MKIAWILDSSSALSEKWKNHDDVYVLPMSVITADGGFKEDIEINIEQLCNRLEKNEEIKTSQPIIGETVELFETLKEKYDLGIPLLMSSNLSGTYYGTLQAATLAEFELLPFDTMTGSAGIQFLLERGIELSEAGKEPKEILETLGELVEKVELAVMVGSLERAKLSGRISATHAFIGGLLKIKPIIEIRDGALEITAKIRTEKKALQHLVDKIESSLDPESEIVYLMQTKALESAEEFEKMLQERVKCRIEWRDLCSAISAHAGLGTVAVSWLKA
ncbi:fatty acid kinase binding subunit FakB2 [Bacillus luti]